MNNKCGARVLGWEMLYIASKKDKGVVIHPSRFK